MFIFHGCSNISRDSEKIPIVSNTAKDSLVDSEILIAYQEPCISELDKYIYYFRIVYNEPFDTSFILS